MKAVNAKEFDMIASVKECPDVGTFPLPSKLPDVWKFRPH